MAHTLAYALPLDDMLSLYDLDFLDTLQTDINEFVGKNLVGREEAEIYPYWRAIGHVVVVNNKYVYSDALGDYPTLWGVIDWDKNVFVVRKKLESFYWGMVANNVDNHPKHVGVNDIDRSSLLVCEFDYSSDASAKEYWNSLMDERNGVPYMLYDPDDYGFSSLMINLYVGLHVMIRRLLGLPYRLVKYESRHEDQEIEHRPPSGEGLTYDI